MNAVFGTSIDCFYCGKNLVKVKLHAFDKAACKYPIGQMGCCKKETIACSTDYPILQAPTTLSASSFKAYTSNYPVITKVDLFKPIFVKEINDHSFIRNAPPREILSLIQVLRI
jgi:hypothetical protein